MGPQIIPALNDQHPTHTAWRRDLHAHPEIGFNEKRTAAFVATQLRAAGFTVTTGIAETGVVGTLRAGDGPSIGLRADMDALPMTEEGERPWASRHPGLFHGCGHDGHTVCLLAAARHLAETRQFRGTLTVIFQPAEEGLGGGRRMVEDGLFDRFPCDSIFGFHNMPLLPFGTTSVRSGPAMASFDEFKVVMTGRGGHAGMPHTTRDPALALAEAACALQGLVSREVSAHAAAVLSVTQIHVGTTHNVVADAGWLGGTVRALDEEARGLLERGLTRVCKGVAAARDVTAEVSYQRGYPVLINDPDQTAFAASVLAGLFNDGFRPDFAPLMAAEDFAFMLQQRPGAYLLFGQGGEGGCMVHNPHYDFDDRLIPIVATALVRLVEARLA
ncbi:M20 family metallopeptidase [Tistrella bauzanensis]|jgi:hippurate hydrolase|uniref:M20 aminoacylase family protein n=1 Tax=Tistrella arctica TaxID=3133430 RepID=A0ABU9YG79_9PROT